MYGGNILGILGEGYRVSNCQDRVNGKGLIYMDVMSEVGVMPSDDSSSNGIMSTHTHNVRSRTFQLDDPASDPFRWT